MIFCIFKKKRLILEQCGRQINVKKSKNHKLLDFYRNHNFRKNKMDYLAKRFYEDSTVKPVF